jgi:hypothetical protein
MRFSYYENLASKDRRTYRRSDTVPHLPLDPRGRTALIVKARAVEAALETSRVRTVAVACNELTKCVCESLGAPVVKVLVRAQRPRAASGELHGLYTRWPDGRARIEVWMRTAAQAKVVRYRTFLRTLLHEICHHVDYTVLGLEDSFHTQGFFRRESSLVRQILGDAPTVPPVAARNAVVAAARTVRRAPRADPKQLNMFEGEKQRPPR